MIKTALIADVMRQDGAALAQLPLGEKSHVYGQMRRSSWVELIADRTEAHEQHGRCADTSPRDLVRGPVQIIPDAPVDETARYV